VKPEKIVKFPFLRLQEIVKLPAPLSCLPFCRTSLELHLPGRGREEAAVKK